MLGPWVERSAVLGVAGCVVVVIITIGLNTPTRRTTLYNFLRCGCREPTDQILATFAELGIPTANLSHNEPTAPFG